MKQITIIGLITVILFSCNSKRDVDKEIRGKIKEFYDAAEAKDYKPISYSALDTIQNITNADGSIIRLTAKMTHEFLAKSNNGSLNHYTDTFDVTIFENEMTVIPRGY